MCRRVKKSNREKIVWLLLGLVGVTGYFGLRWQNFEERMIFGADGGEHMLESYQMWQKKELRLVGPKVGSRQYLGREVFIGPQYYYLLAGLGVVFNWEAVGITKFFSLVELMVFGWFVIWIIRKYGPVEGAMVGTGLVLSPYLIAHNRFIWNPHPVLWLGLILVAVLEKKRWFWVGIVWGLAMSFHFSAMLWVVPIIVLVAKNIKEKWWLVGAGWVLAELPYVVFELRHNFYNLKTLIMIMLAGENKGTIEWHHVISPLLGLGLWLVAAKINKIKKVRVKVVVGIVVVGISCWGQRGMLIDQPRGWNYPEKTKAVKMILNKGCPTNYNVASTVDGNTRANDLRYLLTTKNCPPMGPAEYPKMKKMFLVAANSRPIENETVWEVASGGKFEILRKEKLNDDINLYELDY